MIGHPNLVGYWPLNENGNELINGMTATLYNTPTFQSGIRGQGLTTAYTGIKCAYIPANSLFRVTRDVTLSAFCYLISDNDVSNEIISLTADSIGNGAYALYITTSARIATFYARNATTGYKQASASPAISTGVWNHICGTYDGSYNRIYINGNLSAQTANTGNITYVTTNNHLTIGSAGITVPTRASNIIIDDCQIYNIALTASDIKRIMQGLHPLTRS